MAAHPYNLRTRTSSSSLNNRASTQSAFANSIKSPRKAISVVSALQLRHVIGTTTSTPSGLSCCDTTNSYAYCAGSVAVIATIDSCDCISYRYFKARPTAIPINQTVSFYDTPSYPNTPTRRRTTFTPRKLTEDYGGSPSARDWSEDGHGQTWSARERIKAASCVSLSPDGRILAVGETGYNPRVLLFSTATAVPTDVPLSIIADHTIGVRSVAFSPDSKLLATLGDINDGFLYIWQVNTKTGVVKLHSSNKCTTNVCDIAWCGDNVVTVGTRHIKIWQVLPMRAMAMSTRSRVRHESEVSSPGPVPLQGRNCLLNTFVDATFTAIAAVSEDEAIVCADDGQVCVLNLSNGRIDLRPFEATPTAIAAIACRRSLRRMVWAGGGDTLQMRDLSSVQQLEPDHEGPSNGSDGKRRKRTSRQSLLRQSLGLSPPKRANVIAIGCLNAKVVCIDAEGIIRVSRPDALDDESDVCRLVSHNGIVRGVQKLHPQAYTGSFFTWAGSGEVCFWDDAGSFVRAEMVELDAALDDDNASTNELKILRHCHSDRSFICGDHFGVVKVIDEKSWAPTQTIRAHSAEINSIAIHESTSMIATCGRDRMVQIFVLRNGILDLVQTSDDHISSVGQVLFSHSGNQLLSCSADRTVVVRDRIERKAGQEKISAFIPARTVTMKAAPLSMAFLPNQKNHLVVSTMDRFVHRLDVMTGTTVQSFKASDKESDEAVTLNSICVVHDKSGDAGYLLAGFSSTDKSVRLYDLSKGVLLGRDSGHIEGISDIVMFQDESVEQSAAPATVISTGFDSTIMIWSATSVGQATLTPQQELGQSQAFNCDPEKSIANSPITLPPLRKVLSKMDMAEFARQSSPTRETSPNGLRRRPSKLALSTSIEEADETLSLDNNKTQQSEAKLILEKRSPSPPTQTLTRPKTQRSYSDMKKPLGARNSTLRQSPSPPNAAGTALLTSQRNAKANNSRLRRPPSVPTDLRAHAVAQGRRQSVNGANDFGSIGMATEQACRMLKTYGKKLESSRAEVDLEDVEADLEAVLKIIRHRKARTAKATTIRRGRPNENEEDADLQELGVLLEKTRVS